MADCDPVTNSPIQTGTATLHTNRGDIRIALFGNHAPKTVANFVGLAHGHQGVLDRERIGWTSGPFYDGAVFHRVIAGFMIQGGDPTGTGRGGPGYKFADEFHPELRLRQALPARDGQRRPGHQRLAVLHHRRPDAAPEPASTRSSARSSTRTRSGVVDTIATTATDRSDRPTEPVVIESITIS